MDAIINWLYAHPEWTFVGIMGLWSGIESLGLGFLSDAQRRTAKRLVARVFGK